MLDLSASSSLRTAFADESFSEHPTDGFYVLAAVVLDPASCKEVRNAMLGLRQRLRGRRTDDKLHWNHLARGQREQAVKQVAVFLLPKGRATSTSSTTTVLTSPSCGSPIWWPGPCVPTAAATPLLVMRSITAFTRSTSSRTADLIPNTRKARLPVCPRSPGLATRLAPTVPCWHSW